ncbi:bifunctional UDP-N-acetylglucosamine diphosphorylase/glucosamine-1-phosphate N-acetyltransferase GlmU, partial [Mycobacterium tuberculosis]|nr:bifunctional UDP-N-acetylglucosamine diphosphorylase/glucosamine-1-phosphate N-acetyltransferase GlmU [Mycobacterium tuberculosis]
ADVVVLGFRTEVPAGYGRLITDGGRLIAIREQRDASADEQAIRLCNSGIMAFSGRHILDLLSAIGNDNAKGEYYIT